MAKPKKHYVDFLYQEHPKLKVIRLHVYGALQKSIIFKE